jgi:hypothetical protein
VISEVPDDDEAVQLFEHVVWLIAHDNVAELKRERSRPLDVALAKAWEREREARRRARARAAKQLRD